MNNKKRDYAQAIDLEFLNFEELGRSPFSNSTEGRLDSVAERLPIPHFPTLRKRVGDVQNREFFWNQFGQDLA